MATTLAEITTILEDYTETNGAFLPALNQVLSRLYKIGIYKDLTVQYSLPVVNGRISLPEDAASIIHARMSGNPTPPASLWHDYKSTGDATTGVPVLIDDGYSPVIAAPPEAGVTTIGLSPSVLSPTTSGNPANSAIVVIDADDGTKVLRAEFDGVTDVASFSFDEPVTAIRSIRFEGFGNTRYDLLYTVGDLTSSFATVGPAAGVVRYRRYRVAEGVQDGVYVHVLCRRKFIPLVNDDDISYVDNIGSIKLGLMARMYEDNADLERSDAFWARCAERLDEESDSETGAARPILNVDPYGMGGQSVIEPML